ncbi:hypothetical protein AVEN_8806-1 [Araneus ventricosus]|uniref:Uncharacterized protein n=1 Tax=Araneus ventricosus TaxID=182803 RepID=A0A4Y2UTS1_ARAVE|nr:hypothetical protein AVEN_8806-1 [Araneus ventricosus]
MVRRLALKGENPDSVDKLRTLRSALNYYVQKENNRYLRLTETNPISDPKKFWLCFTNENINSPKSLYYNKVRFECDGDIANAFADFLKSVFKPDKDYDKNDDFKNNYVGRQRYL